MQWWTRESIASKIKKIKDFIRVPNLLRRTTDTEHGSIPSMFFNSKDMMLAIGAYIWICVIVMWILSISVPQLHPENIRGSGVAQSRQSQYPFVRDDGWRRNEVSLYAFVVS